MSDKKAKRAVEEFVAGVVCKAIELERSEVSATANAFDTEIRFHRSVTITYDELLEISKAINTKSIELGYSAGWGGTEVTPGDAPELRLLIGVGYASVTDKSTR